MKYPNTQIEFGLRCTWGPIYGSFTMNFFFGEWQKYDREASNRVNLPKSFCTEDNIAKVVGKTVTYGGAFETKYSQSSKKGIKFSHSEIEFNLLAMLQIVSIYLYETLHKSNSQLSKI